MKNRTHLLFAVAGFTAIELLLSRILRELRALNRGVEDIRSMIRASPSAETGAPQLARRDVAPSGVVADLERIFSQRVI